MEELRAFVAIELGQEVAQRLAEVQNHLRQKINGVRWVDPSAIHLTLKFLGHVPAERTSEIEEALARAVAGTTPFRLQFQGLGCFPDNRSPSVIWVGVEGDREALQRTQGRVEAELAGIGFAPEERGYSPHLTLGRVAKSTGGAERRAIGEAVKATSIDRLGQTQVEGISLMRSQLTPSGARYSQLAHIPLRG